ncbi:MAG: hypothetical protein PHQ36_07045 [Anaerolineales bacterium]|nr:hypothetical protein [Anaerolineales bacterium]
MEKERYTFKCWNCEKTYTLLREITKEQTLTVACPYCSAEAVVDLEPFLKKVKPTLRGEEPPQDLGEELDLPEIFPTRKKE